MAIIVYSTNCTPLVIGSLPLINLLAYILHVYIYIYIYISRLTVVSREAKEEVPCNGLSTNAREYFTRTNLDKIKNAPTDEP